MTFTIPSRVVALGVMLLTFLAAAQKAAAHGVQVAYGKTANGFVRIYIEHWHGALQPNQLGPSDNINVTVTSASGTSSLNVNVSGTVNNTSVANLPGLIGPITVLSAGPSANYYNNWGYWDFAPGTCNQPITITINQGNSVVFTEESSTLYPQTIAAQTFTDQAGPVITAPDITAPGDCLGANVNFAATVVDDCDKNPVVTYSHASGSYFPVGTTPVTVTATDNTGKVSVKTFNVTVFVNDTQGPALTVPASFSVNNTPGQCGANVTFATSATDNCSTATIVNTPASGSFFPVGNTTVTSVATDASGNRTTKTFVVTVVDVQAPTISAPADIVATAGANCQAIVNFAATANDNCPNFVVTYSKNPGTAFGLGETIVTATVTDKAGLTASTTFKVTVEDKTAPAIGQIAQNETHQASGDIAAQLSSWLQRNGGALATDNCGTVTWTNNFAQLSDGCGSTGSATVVFTATDSAGNSSSTTATFAIVDTVAPAIVKPATGASVSCSASSAADLSAWLASNGGAQATDAGGAVTWSHNFAGLAGGCGSTGSATVTFTATDECGNKSTTTATYTVVDTTAPTVVAASSLTVESDGAGNLAALNAWLASNGGATATDNCSTVTWTNNFATVSDGCGATGSATVVFTATDSCGNASTTTATFTIVDTTKPAVVAASNKTVECDGAGNLAALNAWLASNGGASATDLGGSVTWSNNFSAVSDGPGATGSATVTFTATDECGNKATTTATFAIVDTTKPVISASAASKTVESDGNGNTAALAAWLASNGGAVASDICSSVTWTNNFAPLSDGCGSTGTATVTFVATDASGNASVSTATFTIVDTTKPVLSSNVRDITPNEKPVTFTITSSDIGGGSTPSIVNVTATRVNGASKTLDKTGPYKHSVSGNKVTIETSGGVDTVWTIYASAVDDCGNVATQQFVVNVLNPGQNK